MLTSKQFDLFRQEVEQALAGLAKKWDVDIKGGSISYDANSFNLTLKVNKKEINGKSFEQGTFEENCEMYGLKKTDYLKSFNYKGTTYKITGIKTTSKYPVMATSNAGKTLLFKSYLVNELLNQ